MKRCPRSWMGLAAALLLAHATGCGGGGSGGGEVVVVHGSGNVVEELRPIQGVARVLHATEGKLLVALGANEELRVRADDNLLEHLTSHVVGGTLELRTALNRDLEPSQPIELLLTVTALEGASFTGIGSVEIDGLTTDRFELSAGGVGELVLSDLDAVELEVTGSGLGETRITGTVDRQTVVLSGLTEYEALELQSRIADVRAGGTGSATVRVSELLVVHITNIGSVYYLGDPTVDATITGTGELVHLGP